MITFALRRVLATVPVLLAAFTLTFVLIRAAPGDPVEVMFGPLAMEAQLTVTPEQKAVIRRELGLDQSYVSQYGAWLNRVLHGDLGRSFRSKRPVLVELRQYLPATLQLAGAAFAIKLILVFGLGIAAAVAAGTVVDHAVRALVLVLIAVPSFWLGLMLLWLFSVHLGWVTVVGAASPQRLVLPALTLALVSSPRIIRVLRASLLAELGRLHIVFGRAKGLPERLVLGRHALRMALIPTVTLLGFSLTGLVGGSVIAETVFSWPGVGKYVMDAIAARDYPVVQGYILLVTGVTVFGNLIVDLLYAALDPRIRLGTAGRG